jgi:acyl carrier protein
LELVVALQKKYNVRIDDQNQGRFIIRTVQSIADFIASELAARG